MNDTQTTVIIAAGIVLVVLLYLLRYRGTGEAEFTLWDRIRFHVKGSNPPPSTPVPDLPPPPITVAGGDVVGRDKVTIIGQPPTPAPPLSQPSLRLLLVDRFGNNLQSSPVSLRADSLPDQAVFRLTLINEVPNTSAKGVGIRLEIHWRGGDPTTPISLAPGSRPNGWTIETSRITNTQPIVLSFNSPEILVFFGQPVPWKGFRLNIAERLEGHLHLYYRLSSHEPATEAEGTLEVPLSYV